MLKHNEQKFLEGKSEAPEFTFDIFYCFSIFCRLCNWNKNFCENLATETL